MSNPDHSDFKFLNPTAKDIRAACGSPLFLEVLKAHARKLRVPRGEIDNLVNEAVLQLLDRAKKMENGGAKKNGEPLSAIRNLEPFAYTIMRRAACKEFKSKKRAAFRTSDSLQEFLPDTAPGPDQRVAEDSLVERLGMILIRFPAPIYLILTRRIHGVTYQAIADSLGMSLTSTHTLHREILEHVADLLKEPAKCIGSPLGWSSPDPAAVRSFRDARLSVVLLKPYKGYLLVRPGDRTDPEFYTVNGALRPFEREESIYVWNFRRYTRETFPHIDHYTRFSGQLREAWESRPVPSRPSPSPSYETPVWRELGIPPFKEEYQAYLDESGRLCCRWVPRPGAYEDA